MAQACLLLFPTVACNIAVRGKATFTIFYDHSTRGTPESKEAWGTAGAEKTTETNPSVCAMARAPSRTPLFSEALVCGQARIHTRQHFSEAKVAGGVAETFRMIGTSIPGHSLEGISGEFYDADKASGLWERPLFSRRPSSPSPRAEPSFPLHSSHLLWINTTCP